MSERQLVVGCILFLVAITILARLAAEWIR